MLVSLPIQDTYQGHLDLWPAHVGHGRHGLHQCCGEEGVVVACGCQEEGHGDVEGQCEDRDVPLAEDVAQSTGEDGTEGRRIMLVKRWPGSTVVHIAVTGVLCFSREKSSLLKPNQLWGDQQSCGSRRGDGALQQGS